MQTTLYLSPDQRFLSRELMDTTVDFAAAAAAEQARLEQELDRGSFPSKGDQGAPVTVTIFSDFQCPFCKQEAEVLGRLGLLPAANVKLVFRHLPLAVHPWARRAAEMAACVYQQSNDAFWDLHDYLFKKQDHIDNENIGSTVERAISSRSDVNAKEYQQCVADRKGANLVDQDLAFAKDHGIHSTPTIFINGVRNEGAMTLEEMRTLVNLMGDPNRNGKPRLTK